MIERGEAGRDPQDVGCLLVDRLQFALVERRGSVRPPDSRAYGRQVAESLDEPAELRLLQPVRVPNEEPHRRLGVVHVVPTQLEQLGQLIDACAIGALRHASSPINSIGEFPSQSWPRRGGRVAAPPWRSAFR